MGLDAFQDAAKVILEVNRKHINNLSEKYHHGLHRLFEILEKAYENKRFIHFVGAGRSGLAGRIFGDLMKNIGFRVSYIGDALSRPVKAGDVLIAVSSSGWTNSTLMAVEQALKIGALVVGLTASPKSKLGRLADLTITLPGKPVPEEIPYLNRQLLGQHKTPLTPMGTISEIATILTGIGVVSAFNEFKKNNGDPIRHFNDTIQRVLRETETSFNSITKNKNDVEEFISLVTRANGEDSSKIYMYGLGICGIIAKMSLMRYQHLNLNVHMIEDWPFRSSEDTLVLISGSGENNIVVQYAFEAIRSRMNLVGVTANRDSKLAKLASIVIEFGDISTREDYVKLRVGEEMPIFIPLFEFSTLVFLEATVAQIASDLNVSEEDMRARHANIE